MPKEVAHWVIAQRVMERLPEGSLADAVRQHPNCLYLGAVFHDVGYYGQGAAAKTLEQLADRLHGSRGEDTNQILRQFASVFAQAAARPCLAAFLVGLVTHIVADRHLHPMVYYFTGNYYEPDAQKQERAATAHRRLEALMDLRLTGGLAGVKPFSLRRILSELEVPVADLLDDVAGRLASDGAAVSVPDLAAALGFFAKVQWLVRRPLLVRILGLPLRFRPEERGNLFSLTYFADLERSMDLLTPPLEYLNPYSGEPCKQSLEGAVSAIVEKCVAWCTDLPRALWELSHGESLEVGIAAVATADAEHFHPAVLAQDYGKMEHFEMLETAEGARSD